MQANGSGICISKIRRDPIKIVSCLHPVEHYSSAIPPIALGEWI